MVISFAGHRFVTNHSEIKTKIKITVREIADLYGKISCYCGCYGEFDNLCLSALQDLKREGIDIKMIYVTPYISLSQQENIKRMEYDKMFDEIVYPGIENVPPRFVILKRNEWMINESDILIAYVNRNYGGAYQSLLLAKRKGKRIINLSEN